MEEKYLQGHADLTEPVEPANNRIREQLILALENGDTYDFIAAYYYQLSKDELAELIKELLWIVYSSFGENVSRKVEKDTAESLVTDRGFLD